MPPAADTPLKIIQSSIHIFCINYMNIKIIIVMTNEYIDLYTYHERNNERETMKMLQYNNNIHIL